jgi:hypothetical protein
VKLHLLTAVTRQENLPVIARSIARASDGLEIEISWHLRFDRDHRHVGGQAVKNMLLDGVTDGWVHVLDDDTKLHRQVLRRLAGLQENAEAVVFSQQNGGQYLCARLENMRPGHCDIGQAFIRRDVIGDERIPEKYEGDGLFLGAVLKDRMVAWVDEPLSLYNALRR